MPPSAMTTRGNCGVLREQSNEKRAVSSGEEGVARASFTYRGKGATRKRFGGKAV